MTGRLSPHYLVYFKHFNPTSHSDRQAAARRACQAVRYIASLDLDHPQFANGRGF